MVRLTKIYTKTGDKGDTGLGDGSRVAKHDLRVEAYGTVDEANAVIGLARLHVDDELDVILARIQNDLFDVGADLCTPIVENPKYLPLRLAEARPLSLSRRSTGSTRIFRRFAPLSCPRAMRPQRIYIMRVP